MPHFDIIDAVTMSFNYVKTIPNGVGHGRSRH
jgi:hypothetical protein